jgi:6,7-dimethyl-8-ribityllumazine synthase
MNETLIEAQPLPPGTLRLAIVVSEFNESITDGLLDGALARLEDLGFSDDQVTVVWVPGAVEIPLAALLIAKRKQYDAIVCLGAVIRGETSHYDYVCDQVSQGIQRVMLDYQTPVSFGVLTVETEAQAQARIGGNHGHKGADAVEAALAMISVCQQIDDLSA